jgi:hypothetical protein
MREGGRDKENGGQSREPMSVVTPKRMDLACALCAMVLRHVLFHNFASHFSLSLRHPPRRGMSRCRGNMTL